MIIYQVLYYFAILPDIINAFNEMERAEMIKIFMKIPACEKAIGYLKIAYAEFPVLVESFDKMSMKSENGATQGCPLAMMLFAIAYSSIIEELRNEISQEEAALNDQKDCAFIGAIADDTALAAEDNKAVFLYLKLQQLAKDKLNLRFHKSKCAVISFGCDGVTLRKRLKDAQRVVLEQHPNLSEYSIPVGYNDADKGVKIIGKEGGIRLLGAPIGSEAFKIQYMRDIFTKVKEDWQKVLEVEKNLKRRLHLLKFCLNKVDSLNLFRNIEPVVTRQIADELDNWVLSASL